MDRTGTERTFTGLVTGFSEHGDEPSGSIEGKEFCE
jgi:hypothetical protein